MMEVVLEFNQKTGQVVACVSHSAESRDELVPLHVTHFTPMNRVPVLAKDPTGRIPQTVIDYLMEENLKDEDLWWHEYYKERRKYQEDHAEKLALADAQFKQDVAEGLVILNQITASSGQ